MLQPFRLQPTLGLCVNPHIVQGRNCHMATLMAYSQLIFKSESRLSESQYLYMYEIDSFPLWSPSIPLFPCKHVHRRSVQIQNASAVCPVLPDPFLSRLALS